MFKRSFRTIIYAIVFGYVGIFVHAETVEAVPIPRQALATPIAWQPINDTGIIACSNASSNVFCPVKDHPGQDAQFGRDVKYKDYSNGHAGFNFTKVSSTGALLSPFAVRWNCVKDNVTGLFWEVKTDDGRLHDKDWTYTWYEPNVGKNGGSVGTKAGGSCGKTSVCDTAGYVKAVNIAGWCAQKDWRLPTVEELAGIASLDRLNPTIDSNFFPYTQSTAYWSSSPYAVNGSLAWYVYFYHGYACAGFKSSGYYVRLVRGGQSLASLRLAFPLDCMSADCSAGLYTEGAYTKQSVTSVLDHSIEYVYSEDGVVLAWTGEKGEGPVPAPEEYAVCHPNVVVGKPFSVSNTYIGTYIIKKNGEIEDCTSTGGLNYDGHPGYDYKAGLGTPVKAAADGVVVDFDGQRCIPKGTESSGGCEAWGAVGILHQGGYVTQYMHLSLIDIDVGDTVRKGQVIGASGDTNVPGSPHLHFEVLKQVSKTPIADVSAYKVVDPYGWSGTDVDPLADVTGVENVRLWE